MKNDVLYMRAEDFTPVQQRQVYNQLRKRANRRLERRRAENNVVYQNKNVSQFLKRRGYKYFPIEKSIKDSDIQSYLNELLLYVQDRTSTAEGIKAVKQERLEKFMKPQEFSGQSLVHGVTAQELDAILVSDEFAYLRTLYDYELLLEDFSNEIERGYSVERILSDWRKLIEDETMSYSDYRKMLENNYIIERRSSNGVN